VENLKQTSRARIGAIAVAGAATRLAFPGVASAAVTSSVTGGVLTATNDGADPIAITCVGGQVKVNGANPAPATNCDALTSIVVNGGQGVNAISLAGVTTAQFGNVASTTVDAGDLNDTITGSERDDTMVWTTTTTTSTRAAPARTRSRSTVATAASSSPSSPPRLRAVCSSTARARRLPVRSTSTSAPPSGST